MSGKRFQIPEVPELINFSSLFISLFFSRFSISESDKYSPVQRHGNHLLLIFPSLCMCSDVVTYEGRKIFSQCISLLLRCVSPFSLNKTDKNSTHSLKWIPRPTMLMSSFIKTQALNVFQRTSVLFYMIIRASKPYVKLTAHPCHA
jgi:hypothetical protein